LSVNPPPPPAHVTFLSYDFPPLGHLCFPRGFASPPPSLSTFCPNGASTCGSRQIFLCPHPKPAPPLRSPQCSPPFFFRQTLRRSLPSHEYHYVSRHGSFYPCHSALPSSLWPPQERPSLVFSGFSIQSHLFWWLSPFGTRYRIAFSPPQIFDCHPHTPDLSD